MIRQGSRNILPGEPLPDVEVVELRIGGYPRQIRFNFDEVEVEGQVIYTYEYINLDEVTPQHMSQLPGKAVKTVMQIQNGKHDKKLKKVIPSSERSKYVRR